MPNKSIAIVSLRSTLESKEFKKSDAALTVALGMDVSGKSWVASLERAPHMLVARRHGKRKIGLSQLHHREFALSARSRHAQTYLD